MTDVVTHADSSPADGPRRPDGLRAHRPRRGLRVPRNTADETRGTPPGDSEAHARHRRTPDTNPVAIPTVTEPGASRHRAAHRS